MEKIVKLVDKERGLVQITTVSERWYARPVEDPKTRLPIYQYVPSVTWICDFYPKGIGFFKWLAEKGWDEAQALKEAGGNRGSKVHQAITALLDGLTVLMEDKFINSDGEPEDLTLEEYAAILSFASWFKGLKAESSKLEVVGRELVVWNKDDNYAGTVDLVMRVNGDTLWLIDFKTSQSIYPGHILQVSAYKHAVKDWSGARLAILQLGYRRNKQGFKFTEVPDKFELFKSAQAIWAEETKGQSPLQRDYPVSISLEQTPKPKAELETHAVATE